MKLFLQPLFIVYLQHCHIFIICQCSCEPIVDQFHSERTSKGDRLVNTLTKKKWFLKTNAIQSTGFSETDMVINTNWSDYFIDENMRFCAFKSLYCNGVMVCNALNIYIVNNSTNMQMLQVSCDFLPIVKHWGCPTFTWPKYALDF